MICRRAKFPSWIHPQDTRVNAFYMQKWWWHRIHGMLMLLTTWVQDHSPPIIRFFRADVSGNTRILQFLESGTCLNRHMIQIIRNHPTFLGPWSQILSNGIESTHKVWWGGKWVAKSLCHIPLLERFRSYSGFAEHALGLLLMYKMV